MSNPLTPRNQRQIQSVIRTIWHKNGRVKCPVCAHPMKQTENYIWKCGIGHCPIQETAFNERIHNYGVNQGRDKRYEP